MDTVNLANAKIAQLMIPVDDFEKGIAFYRDVLGIPFLFSAPPQMAFFDCGGIRLMLSRPEKPEFDHPSSIIYFRVGDIQAMYQTLRERGVPFDDEPHLIASMDTYDLWMAFFRDPDKNVFGIMSEVPHS